jgi:hypothetical protein
MLSCLFFAAAFATTTPPIRASGRVMLDTRRVLDEPRADDDPWLDIRRARIQAHVRPAEHVYGKFDWNLETMSVHDLYADLGPDALQVRVGRSKTPISATFLESSLHLPFAERPMMHDVLGSGRYHGVGVSHRTERWVVEAAGGQVGPFEPATASTEGYAHALASPADTWWISASTGIGHHRAAQPIFVTAAGTEWATSPVLEGFGTRSTAGVVFAPGPWRFGGELMGRTLAGPEQRLRSLGGYAEVLVRLTGESNPYGKRLIVERPLPEGPGAFEVGARIEHAGVDGVVVAAATSGTAGLTWYPHDRVKWINNLVVTDLPERDEVAVVVRWQVDV